jgi:tetratricopeptide (TPR) repeat protein
MLTGTGPLRRQLDSGYRGTDYDFVTATSQGEGTIAFTLDSKRARTEVRAQVTQARLVRELVLRASTAANQDPQIGRTLFHLLVPMEVEPFLGGTSRMLLELDDGTASIPWELLDTPQDRGGGGDQRPWAIRCQLLRKLRTDDYRDQVQDAALEDNVLVIGEPLVDPKVYPRLPGALAEGRAVARALAGSGGVRPERLTALLDHDDANTVINALYSRRYRIVHIAGHGEPGLDGGVVMSGGTFLGAHEIRSMRTVPELVFVNCCHLAARAPGLALRSFDRSAFAASVADELIRIGVRCVIAAGWAVDDAPASLFATTFYQQLLAGQNFIAAVASAREAAWTQGGNTWAAYQCYGDPNWRFAEDPAAGSASNGIAEEYSAISSPLGLAIALEELAVKSRWQGARPAAQLQRARHLESRFGRLWGGMGAVAEAFALAFAEAGARDVAIEWYERALESNDASASMKAAEQLGALRARRAGDRAHDMKRGDPELETCRQELTRALRGLQTLAALQSTCERETLVGSTWKRLAQLELLVGDADAGQGSMIRAIEAYRRAEALAAAVGDPMLYYPALNRMALELVMNAGQGIATVYSPAETELVRSCLQSRMGDDADFWSLIGLVDLDLYCAAAEQRLVAQQADAEAAFADLHNRVPSATLWQSVAEQAELALGAYASAAPAAEATAARRLIELLNGYAA